MDSANEIILKGKKHNDEDDKKGESETEASSSWYSNYSSEEEEEEKEDQKTDSKSLSESSLLKVGNVLLASSHRFCHDFRVPTHDGFVVDGLLKELTFQKQNRKHSFSTLNNNNHVNNKNTHVQFPIGKSKQTKNRIMNAVRHAAGNGGDESQRASHAINNL